MKMRLFIGEMELSNNGKTTVVKSSYYEETTIKGKVYFRRDPTAKFTLKRAKRK